MKEKLYRFMQGRYGNDQLNRFLMILVIVCLVLSMLGIRPFYIGGILFLVFSYYRMLSKKYNNRRAENSVYLPKDTTHTGQGNGRWARGKPIISTNARPADRRSGFPEEKERSRSGVRNAGRPLLKKADNIKSGEGNVRIHYH